jgi:hypothetical protein
MLTRNTFEGPLLIAVLCATFVTAAILPAAAADIEEQRTPSTIAWSTAFDWESAQFAISGPCGDIAWTVSAGTALQLAVEDLEVWGVFGGTELDGQYNYEISFAPFVDPAKRAELDRLRADADGAGPVSAAVPELPVVSGSFRVSGGTIVGAGSGGKQTEAIAKDVVHYDDVITTGSLCVGFDCANGESFGYDTVKLKENNLRFYFEDTSAGSFPSGDWRLRINDTTSGGASYFAVEDGTNGRTPFRIETGAPTHSLYVEDYGRVGLGTSIPYVELHIVDGDSPTMRLDQDGSSGWTAQRWDMMGNETNFFIRDVTNGSRMPFRIQPSTPSSTLSLKSTGNVGIGTWSPAAPLEIETTGETSSLLLDRTDGGQWYLSATGDGTFTVGTSVVEGEELLILDNTGNLTTSGTVNGISDRNVKRDFAPVDSAQVLDAVARLAVTEWSLLGDSNDVRHMGPTAQDFRAAFGLGGDERHIALSDMSGVALAAIQALVTQLEERDREIEDLSHRLRELEELVTRLR